MLARSATTQPEDPLGLVGTTLAGKYDVERVVAETELSLVYRATHRVWRRPAAIKAFKASTLGEGARQELLESFLAEGALLMDLSERCAAICQARDVSSVITARGDWVPYMVLEWLEGEPLDVMVARERTAGLRPRTPEAARRLLDPIAQALAFAHERGIVHRDVKPGNVFVLADAGIDGACCKLLDFGIAKVASLAGRESAAPHSFTPAYAAPEQFAHEHAGQAVATETGPWTDVFALALVFVELVAGRSPLNGKSVAQLASASGHPRVRPTPRALGATVGEEVERVIGRAVAVRPDQRYANAREFWTALARAIAASERAVAPARRHESAFASPRTVGSLAATARRRAGTTTASSPSVAVPPSPSDRVPRPPALRPRWVVPTLAVLVAAVGVGLVALQQLAVWRPPHAETWGSPAAPAAIVQLHSEHVPTQVSRVARP